MDFDRLTERIKDINPAIDLHCFKEIDSTNTYAYYLGQQKYPEWNIVFAEIQTAGKGRLNRKWYATRGKSLLFSILLRPQIPAEDVQLLSLFMGEITRQALQNYLHSGNLSGFSLQTKWPNDIYLNGRKLAGILIKTAISSKKFDFVVAGIGINVNQNAQDFPEEIRHSATSLLREFGKDFSLEEIFTQIIRQLYEAWPDFIRFPQNILPIWKKNTLYLHQRIRVHHFDSIVEGTFVDVNAHGHLIVRNENGVLEVLSGDIAGESAC